MLLLNYQHCIALWFLTLTASCHVVITYPGSRGNNLARNGSVEDTNGLGVSFSDDKTLFPYGMQWIYPCGGLPITQNRTNWPISGGAIAFQPGWFHGHKNAFIYINLGFGSVPENYSEILVPRFEIRGPTDNPYDGSICLPHVPLQEGTEVKVGGHATIQIVEAATHGAAMYSCVDITFADLADVDEPDTTTCFNSTNIRIVSEDDSLSPTTSSGWGTSDTADSTGGRGQIFPSETSRTGSSATSETPNSAARSSVRRAIDVMLLGGLFGVFQ